MIVAGGLYRERCIQPSWDAIYGSGGRAAIALSNSGSSVDLYTTADKASQTYWDAFTFESKCRTEYCEVEETRYFGYWTPLHAPVIAPPAAVSSGVHIEVAGELVLRFGMLDGTAMVHGASVVYDPQSEENPEAFRANGSEAKRLAIVCNAQEARSMTGRDNPHDAAAALLSDCAAVFIKLGPSGAIVATKDGTEIVRPYATKRVFKLGSGDVFSAAVLKFWGERQLAAAEAGDLASRAVALYVDRRTLMLDEGELRNVPYPRASYSAKRVYVAAPFFDLGQRRALEDVIEHLRLLGHEPVSPLHVVGSGGDPSEIAEADIGLLRASDIVFAMLDGADAGTLFEVGYARALEKPVVAYGERVSPQDLTMVTGSGGQYFDDYVGALYGVGWI